MDYKEKYENALSWARSAINAGADGLLKEDLQHIFPELEEPKESEDKKIIKVLIHIVKGACDDFGIKYRGIEITEEKLLAWIENHKTTDKIEPKFKVGDWIVQNGVGIYKIVEVCESWYEVIDFEDNCYSISFDKEYMCHPWTIQDAKDGDMLGYPEGDYPWIGIFHKLNAEDTFSSYCYLQAGVHSKFCSPSGENIFGKRNVDNHSSKYAVPATKEQRDLLFKKMKEEGYEWDAEKKELRKIEQKPTNDDIKEVLRTEYEKDRADVIAEMQNPTWSEEDEDVINHLLAICAGANRYRQFAGCLQEDITKYQTWLKSLKERMKGE